MQKIVFPFTDDIIEYIVRAYTKTKTNGSRIMNIYDIARLSGVSIATVSRVVNDSPKVSDKTKEKVRKVMEENNYTPNVFARGLGLGSMQTLGIICQIGRASCRERV